MRGVVCPRKTAIEAAARVCHDHWCKNAEVAHTCTLTLDQGLLPSMTCWQDWRRHGGCWAAKQGPAPAQCPWCCCFSFHVPCVQDWRRVWQPMQLLVSGLLLLLWLRRGWRHLFNELLLMYLERMHEVLPAGHMALLPHGVCICPAGRVYECWHRSGGHRAPILHRFAVLLKFCSMTILQSFSSTAIGRFACLAALLQLQLGDLSANALGLRLQCRHLAAVLLYPLRFRCGHVCKLSPLFLRY